MSPEDTLLMSCPNILLSPGKPFSKDVYFENMWTYVVTFVTKVSDGVGSTLWQQLSCF